LNHPSSDQSDRPAHPPERYVDYDDEIDLAAYIGVVIKRKWLIIIGTLLCFLLGIGYSSTKKQAYEARASLLVIPPPYKTELASPTFSMDVYEELSKAQDLRQAIIDSLELYDQAGKKLTISSVDGLLRTELVQATGASQSVSGSSLMHLFVTSVDTVLLPPVKIANKWAELFVEKNSGISSQETGGSYDFIRKQYIIARDTLQALEDTMVVFNQRYNIDILKADLTPTNAKLTAYQVDMVNLSLELNGLEETLRSQEKYLLAVETSLGQWVGALDIQGFGGIIRRLLEIDQQRILDTTIRNRNNVQALREQVRDFEDEKDLFLMKEDLQLKRSTLVTYMNELSRIAVDMSSVSQVLKELKQNGENTLIGSGAIVETLPAETLREFASLHLGYNLLIPRHKHLTLEVERLKIEIDSLEITYTDNTLTLALLQEKLITAEQSYQSLLTQYRETKSQINNLKLSINTLRPKVKYQISERYTLERKTKNLAAQIAKLELERDRFNRNITVYKSTFDKFADLLEDARVAKANQASDIKVVAWGVDAVSLSPKLLITIFIFGIAGGFGTFLLAFILEYVEKAQVKIDETL
jgi:uncharacterized protein involved in exopolysaccharide biosynthesis